MVDNFDPITFFKHSFGISITYNKPEEVVLSFSPLEGKYIKNQSIHTTQKILTDNNKEVRISINVMVSYELQMQLLSYGDQVKVIKPASLAKTVKSMLQKALDRY